MTMNRLLVVFVLLLVAVAAPFAAADTIVWNGVNIGTVTLTQVGSNVTVEFKITNSNYAFKINGADFLFNTGGATTSILAGSITVDGSSYAGSFKLDGNSTRGGQSYSYDLTQLKSKAGLATDVTFTLTNITVAQLESGAFGVHACLLANGGGCSLTGFGSTGGQPTVPEPGTLSLLGTGLVGLAGVFRRRFLA
jgi:PEP-CTERM motif